jgi:phosphohistidine swiveling domain-containing protein
VTLICHLDEWSGGDAGSLGGKGFNLARLIQAGLSVPPAFCLKTTAYRQSCRGDGASPQASAELCREIEAAYQRLGAGLVAIRSSATGEDSDAASFAGLQETILGVEGPTAVIDAVERCWRSLQTQRARTYRRERDIDESQLAMAVVVQKLVPAEMSGVMFTRDPLDSEGISLLVEAAWGLGEAIVSGRVNPDRFRLERQSGTIIERQIAEKTVRQTVAGLEPVATEARCAACLDARQLAALHDLAKQVEEFFGGPRDVEWAWADGRLWLLQARPITAPDAFEREQLRREEIARLTAMAEPGGTVWARYNLAEVLPAPTPMTWSIVRRFMSGRGGVGLMYRDLGFDPDPIVDELGFNDLICGRTFVNLSREAKAHFRRFPYHHHVAELKEHPERAIYPTPKPDPAQVRLRFVASLPLLFFQIYRAGRRVRRESRSLPERLRKQIFPQFAAEVAAARQVALDSLDDQQLLDRLHYWIARTLNDFARWSLRPALLAAESIGRLERMLSRAPDPDRDDSTTVRTLLAGVCPDAEADLGAALQALGAGALSRDEFLDRFGHRGPQEMELATPRWREDSSSLTNAAPVSSEPRQSAGNSGDGPQMFNAKAMFPNPRSRHAWNAEVRRARDFLALRETGKHDLMLGYELIRQALLEIARRFQLSDYIFYLELDELPRVVAGENLAAIAAERRRRRSLLLTLEISPVLFSDDLAAIGRSTPVSSAAQLRGTPVSVGVAEGVALVLHEPRIVDEPPADFILVCPSTDPAWLPLFLRAKGLVMETGGVLSHGAILAREFGLPAVAGIAHALSTIHTGQRVRVDGNRGDVYLLDG